MAGMSEGPKGSSGETVMDLTSPQAASERRWRFSLRTLFVAVSAIAVIVGIFTGFVRFQDAMERAALRDGIRRGSINPGSARLLLSADEIVTLTAERDQFLAEVAVQLGPPASGIGPAPIRPKTQDEDSPE